VVAFSLIFLSSSASSQLNHELTSKSVYLLDTLNVLVVEYIPLLQRILVKATTAALADDETNEGSGTATPNSRSRTPSNSATSARVAPMPAPPPPLLNPTRMNASVIFAFHFASTI
jgi:hypothetical protein